MENDTHRERERYTRDDAGAGVWRSIGADAGGGGMASTSRGLFLCLSLSSYICIHASMNQRLLLKY